MQSILDILAWLACGIYSTIPFFWLLIHPFADWWRAKLRAPLKVMGPVWVVQWVIAWAISAPWRHDMLLHVRWLWLLALPMWAVTVYIYFGGKRHFSLMQVIGRNELEPDRQPQELVITGLHARMRHPLYAGHIFTMLGWFTLAPTAAVAGLMAVAFVAGAVMIRTEDAELEQRFGEPYRRYRRSTPAVLPKL